MKTSWIIKIGMAILLQSTIVCADYSTALDEARAKQMADYKEKESAIFARIENRILQTSNFNLTRSDVQQGWGLPYTYFNNFEKQSCSNSGGLCIGNTGNGINISVDLTKQQIVLSNSLGLNANSANKELYSNERNNEILIDSNFNAIKPFTISLSNMYELYKEIVVDPNNTISVDTPSDTSKMWYKPNGYGGYNIFAYKDGVWTKIGSTSGEGKNIVHVKTEDELKRIPCAISNFGYVGDGDVANSYICNAEGQWEKLSTGGGEGGLFNGDAAIPSLAYDLISKAGGSIATSSAVNGEFGGAKDFTKKDNSVTGGYWVDSTNMFVVGKNLASLRTQTWALNAIGYTSKTKTSVYVLKRMNVNGTVRWVYLADGYDQVATMFNDIENDEGGFVYDTVNAKFFYRNGSVWYSTDSKIQLTENGRTSFSLINSGYTYLTNVNDCTALTCNGSTATGYYAGSKQDNMYVFYSATAGNRLNNLIDAKPRNSIAEMYDNEDIASLYNNAVYFKDTDTRDRLCYKRSDGVYYTKGGNAIPTSFMVSGKPNMPPAKTCSDASWSGTYLVLNNRTQATDWSDAPHGVGANIGGVNYMHLLGSGKDFWTNNGSGDGQQNATEIFTKGSRSQLPLVTKSLTALTKNVGTEARYTTNGVVASIDNSFKQWWYSVTGTRKNNLMDAKIAKNFYNDINAGTHIVNAISGKRLTDGKVWGTHEVFNNYDLGKALETTLYCSNGSLYVKTGNGGGSIYEKSNPFILITNQKGGTFSYYAPGTGSHNLWDGTYANYHVIARFGAFQCGSCYKMITDWH